MLQLHINIVNQNQLREKSYKMDRRVRTLCLELTERMVLWPPQQKRAVYIDEREMVQLRSLCPPSLGPPLSLQYSHIISFEMLVLPSDCIKIWKTSSCFLQSLSLPLSCCFLEIGTFFSDCFTALWPSAYLFLRHVEQGVQTWIVMRACWLNPV